MIRKTSAIISQLTDAACDEFAHLYKELTQIGIHYVTIRNIIRAIIAYIVDVYKDHLGPLDEQSIKISNEIIANLHPVLYVGTIYGIPYSKNMSMIRDITRWTLEQLTFQFSA